MDNLETIELMSPAGKIVVNKKDMHDYLNRKGWSLIKEASVKEPEISLDKLLQAEFGYVPQPEIELPIDEEIPQPEIESIDEENFQIEE